MPTIYYGWDVPSDDDYVKDTAAYMRTLGNDIDATLYTINKGSVPNGLNLIVQQTIGNNVSSVSVNDCFSTTYDSYKIIISGGVGSNSGNNFSMRLRVGGVDSTTGYAYSYIYNTYGSATISAAGNGGNILCDYLGTVDQNTLAADITVINPFLSKWTHISAPTPRSDVAGHTAALHKVNTSYTGFTIFPSVGTVTGGTIRVYGYRSI